MSNDDIIDRSKRLDELILRFEDFLKLDSRRELTDTEGALLYLLEQSRLSMREFRHIISDKSKEV